MNKYWKKEMRHLRDTQCFSIPKPSEEEKCRLEAERNRLLNVSIRCSSDAYAVYDAMHAAYESAKPEGWWPLMAYDLLKDPNARFWNRQYRRIKKRNERLERRINRCARLSGKPVMNRKMKVIYEVFTSSI
jgi:hypothetical protein